jgi:hypothetical protein
MGEKKFLAIEAQRQLGTKSARPQLEADREGE